jgi:hypothetical protein
MIDLALNNLYLLGAALIVGVVTGRWAFSSMKGAAPAPAPKQEPKQEDDATS